jgi:hypothetical protein
MVFNSIFSDTPAFGGGFGGFSGFESAGKPLFSAESQADTSERNANDDECRATFEPVLSELPPEIEVSFEKN